VVYLIILKHKLVFLLPRGAFTNIFPVGVVTRDMIKWLEADLTAFSVLSAKFNIFSYDELHLNPLSLAAACYVMHDC